MNISKNMSLAMNELEKLGAFMKKYRNDSRNARGKMPWTHAMMYDPYGSYNIPNHVYDEFSSLYEDAICAGYMPYIMEKHKPYGPIVMDFDFIQSEENRTYTATTIASIIQLYNTVIKKYLKASDQQMDAYVREKEKPTLRRGEYHDGLHIVYPYICTKASIQLLMRTEFVRLADKHKIFQSMPLINDLESVFDKNGVYNTGWMMYGSRKNKYSDAYYVTHIYHAIGGQLYDLIIPKQLKTRPAIKHFVDAFSCRRFSSRNDITPFADGRAIIDDSDDD